MYEGPGLTSIPSANDPLGLLREKNPQAPIYKDIFFGILFVLQLLVVVGLAFSYGIMALSSTVSKHITLVSNNSEVEEAQNSNSALMIGGMFTLLFLGCFLSVFMVISSLHNSLSAFTLNLTINRHMA